MALVAVGLLMVVVAAKPAGAAFPGANGKIAFVRDRNDPNAGTEHSMVYVMDPNGSGTPT